MTGRTHVYGTRYSRARARTLSSHGRAGKRSGLEGEGGEIKRTYEWRGGRTRAARARSELSAGNGVPACAMPTSVNAKKRATLSGRPTGLDIALRSRERPRVRDARETRGTVKACRAARQPARARAARGAEHGVQRWGCAA